jgi:hypothetical protein
MLYNYTNNRQTIFSYIGSEKPVTAFSNMHLSCTSSDNGTFSLHTIDPSQQYTYKQFVNTST